MILDDDRGINPKEQLMSSCVHSILPNTSLASVHPGSSSPRWTAKVGMLEAALLEHQIPKVKKRRAPKAGIFTLRRAINLELNITEQH